MTDVEDQTEEPDYTTVIGKAPTALQARMAEWIRSDEVGYDPNTAKSKMEAFNEGVRIAVAHRMNYQASAHNKEATAIEREERAALRAKALADREAARAAAPVAEVPAPAPAVKPTKAGRPAKAAKAAPAPAAPATAPAATRAPARRAPARRAPAAAATPAADAPF